jgi:hypothetical protein
MYKPVKRSKASGSSGEYVTHAGGWPCVIAAKLASTVNVKAMDSQRWVCRINLLQFNGTSSQVKSWDRVEQVDELPAHHLPAVACAAEVLLLGRLLLK